jgi:hypothetical protein
LQVHSSLKSSARKERDKIMMTVNVLLSGRLKLDGYGQGHLQNNDGTFRLALAEGATVQDIIECMGVPGEQVIMTMVNARRCPVGANLRPGDRVILMPPDVAALWRFLGVQNMGMESVCDF